MTEYDDYVSGRVDANYQEWLEKNLPEHRPEDLTRGHWCDFCQTFHSSQSCYHPGGNMLRETQNRIASLESALERYRGKNAELIESGISLSEQLHTVTLAKLTAESEREFIIGLHAKNHPGCGSCSEMFQRWKEAT